LWKVLRDTEGERFVTADKGAIFLEIFERVEKQINALAIVWRIEILLYVIIYPHALELFALRKNQFANCNRMNLR
jgi:hypothetical protein